VAKINDPQVSIDGGSVVLQGSVETPQQAQKFLKPTLTLRLAIDWQPGSGERVYIGQANLSASEQVSASMAADVAIIDNAPGSTVHYKGVFKVSIPLVGKKLESQAGPLITQILDVQQDLGRKYLEEHQ
jgi:hypothetical protein